MRNTKRYSVISIVIFVFLCITINNFAKDVKVTIFHMNDIHSNIKNFAKVAKIVKEAKMKNKNVYLFNCGDNFSGNPIVDQFDPRGEPLLILFKLMNFDVLALGNHDFDYGHKVLRRFILKSSFRTLCANFEDTKGLLKNVSPYTILKTDGGLKIALLGLIQVEKDTKRPSTHPKNIPGIIFKDELDTIEQYEFLQKKNNALIVLSHMGFEKDVKSSEKFNWIDLIIGGHSHTIIEEPKEFNGVLITQAGSKGEYLGKVDLVFRNKVLISKTGTLIDLTKVKKEDEEIKKIVKNFNSNETMKRVITNLPFRLEGKRELGNMICDAIIDHQNVDIALMNRGGIRIGRLNKKVTVKDIYTMHPFNNDLIVFNLTPTEIRSLIETSFKKGGKIDLYSGGLSYTVFKPVSKKFGIEKIILKDKNGELLNESKKYSVCVNNYIASSYKFKKEDAGKSANITLAEVVTEYLKSRKTFSNYKKIVRTEIKLFIDKDAKTIGVTAATISNEGIREGSCSSGNLITDALRSELKADVAFYPSRNINAGTTIKASEKIYMDFIPLIYKYSSTNKIISGYIKGKDISDFLFKILKYRNKADLQVAGINYTIRKNKSGKVVGLDCYIEKKRIVDSKIYKAVFTDYEFEKFYDIKDKVENIQKSKRTIVQILNDYIVKQKKISKSIEEKRIKIIEEN